MAIKEAQERVDAWISRFEEGYWPPLTNLARLIEEVGELAREMNHLFGHKPKRPDEPDQDLAIELADVLFVILVIANEQGIDLDRALEGVLAKYRIRDAERWTPVDARTEGVDARAERVDARTEGVDTAGRAKTRAGRAATRAGRAETREGRRTTRAGSGEDEDTKD